MHSLRTVPPEVAFTLGFYELHRDSDAAPGRPTLPFEQVAHAQLGTNPVGPFGFS